MDDLPANPTAAYMLATYQEQLDPDGVNVGVSRQALDEVLEQLEQQAKSIYELVEALEEACDFALMPDHECPEDIQPKISGLMDLANKYKTNKQDK